MTLNNEVLLYQIVKRGIGVLEAHQPRPFIWQEWHGLHLGQLRVRQGILDWMRINEPFRKGMRDIVTHPLFAAMTRELDHPELNYMFEELQREFVGQ